MRIGVFAHKKFLIKLMANVFIAKLKCIGMALIIDVRTVRQEHISNKILRLAFRALRICHFGMDSFVLNVLLILYMISPQLNVIHVLMGSG